MGDIPAQVIEDLGITVIPLYIRFGEESYRDGVELTTDEFYHKLGTSSFFPQTSTPAPLEFIQLYEKLAEETDELISIHLSSKLSATYEVALRAKSRMEKACRVEVIDSRSVLMGEGLLVIQTAEAARRGESLEQITTLVNGLIDRIHIRACFDTLEYLRRGGRIGKAQALLGTLLKVHPILGVEDGETIPIGRERSRAKGLDWLYSYVKGFSRIEALAVEHATTPDEAEALAERLAKIFPKDQIYMTRVGAAIGTHVGPHVIAVCLIEG
jgi:DegV family protein with EDD domain